ncbi:MAG: hypothetical protein B6A08_20190 [Sorangiineae bacterium NIC37A_2]|nr:MAG: hypothetical protein B6A08_20190 [Sorangiineae bacterium NIC37A_2]
MGRCQLKSQREKRSRKSEAQELFTESLSSFRTGSARYSAPAGENDHDKGEDEPSLFGLQEQSCLF